MLLEFMTFYASNFKKKIDIKRTLAINILSVNLM